MTRFLAALLVFVVALGMNVERPRAQQRPVPACAPWSILKQGFDDRFHEVAIGGGIVNSATIVTVLASANGGTWSIVVIDRLGMACVIAAGAQWDPGVNPPADKTGEKS